MSGSQYKTMAEDAAERDVAARWPKEPALRAEFGNNRETCDAYFRAVARGNARRTKENVRSLVTIPDAPAAAAAPAEAVPEGVRAVAAADDDISEDEIRKALRQRWNANAALRAEFAEDFELFEGFEKANAADRVKILGQPSARPRDGSAATPIAPAAAGAPDASAAMAKRQRQIASALAAGWYQDPALQEEFPNADAYIEAVRTRAVGSTNRRAP